MQELNLTGQGEAVRLVGSTVSANLFSVLGRGAALGRTFEAGDDRPGRDRIVLLSHALWQSRFGGDPAAVGRTITVEGVDRQVVGVMPPGFHFPSASAQLWVPLRLDPEPDRRTTGGSAGCRSSPASARGRASRRPRTSCAR